MDTVFGGPVFGVLQYTEKNGGNTGGKVFGGHSIRGAQYSGTQYSGDTVFGGHSIQGHSIRGTQYSGGTVFRGFTVKENNLIQASCKTLFLSLIFKVREPQNLSYCAIFSE